MTTKRKQPKDHSKLREYRLAIGPAPSLNLYVCVKGQPHLAYSLAAFQQLVQEQKIRP